MSTSQHPTPMHGAEGDIAQRLDEAGRVLELADPDAGQTRVDRAVNKSVEFVGVVMLAGVFLIIFFNAFMRYFANVSLLWAEEVVLGLIPWLAMLGLFLSARRRQMVTVEVIARFAGPRMVAWLGHFANLVCMCAFAYLAVVSWQYASTFGRTLTPYLGLPKGLSLVAFSLGAAIVALAFAAALIRGIVKVAAQDRLS